MRPTVLLLWAGVVLQASGQERDLGLTYLNVTLQRESAAGFGLRLYSRTSDYTAPVAGDELGVNTAIFPAVSEVVPGSPADRAGVRRGDLFLGCNGVSTHKLRLREVAQLMGRAPVLRDAVFWRRSALWTPARDQGFVICVVAYNRPRYLAQVLRHFAACRGIEKYTVFIFCEPGHDDVVDVARGFTAAKEVVVHVNRVQFGCAQNIRQAIEVGFTRADFVLLVEDDILLAPDALEFVEWARGTYQNDRNVFSVTLYGDIGHSPNATALTADEHHSAARRQHFTPWGWAMWQDRFVDIAHVYTGLDAQLNFDFPHARKGPNYDGFNQGLRGGRTEVFPLLSRANNIGMEGGIHAQWYDAEQMKDLQFLHRNTAPGLPDADGEHLGVTAPTRPFTELSASDRERLCARCGVLSCGRDTIRGMCDSAGVEVNIAGSLNVDLPP